MDFNEYQKLAKTTLLVNPNVNFGLLLARLTLGVTGEAGEVAEKVKKLLRDKNGKVDKEFVDGIGKELFDVVWYIANLAGILGLELNDLAQQNIDKLQDRKKRGVLGGSGDAR